MAIDHKVIPQFYHVVLIQISMICILKIILVTCFTSLITGGLSTAVASSKAPVMTVAVTAKPVSNYMVE